MALGTLTTAIEKIQPTAILKLDGAFNDFHAKEVMGIIEDLLNQDLSILSSTLVNAPRSIIMVSLC